AGPHGVLARQPGGPTARGSPPARVRRRSGAGPGEPDCRPGHRVENLDSSRVKWPWSLSQVSQIRYISPSLMNLFATVDPRSVHFMVVAGAGTHGKTTTTVMVTDALAAAGRNPTGLAGGRVATWGGNARVGGRELYVVEADEFDRAFLSLAPTVAVVNNVEADHLECYGGSVAALEDAFAEFAARARRAIVGADDAGAARVAARLGVPAWRVGLGAGADVRIADPAWGGRGSAARIELPGGRALALRLRVPGLPHCRNAAA